MRLASSKLSELSPILILFHLCFLPSCLLEISFENPALVLAALTLGFLC